MKTVVRGATYALVTWSLAVPVCAQVPHETPLEIGSTLRIESRSLGETRVVDVSLPDGYEDTLERYPLLIVLDGESLHETATALTRFYASTAVLPRMIVVGVRNARRSRDMTPPAVAGFTPPPEVGASGGADRFLAFLTDELIPQLEASYRTAPMRVLVGHSLGGLFALYTLTRRPGFFTGYVVMEPAMWWNDGLEYRDAFRALALPESRHTRLISVNVPDPGVDTTRWGSAAPMVRFRNTSGETHASMPPAGVTLALRTMFEDFLPPSWSPGTRPIAMLERYDSLSARVGYAVPIPDFAYTQVIRMSIDARFFDDAERALVRMERALGATGRSRDLKASLSTGRATPAPPDLIPLVIPETRPTPGAAATFLGSWALVGDSAGHTIDILASRDTIVVHSRIRLGRSDWDEADRTVIQVTAEGQLEWGLAWFRGLAALLVLRAEVLPDGTMRVTREPRGWVPRGPGAADMTRVELFRRVAYPRDGS